MANYSQKGVNYAWNKLMNSLGMFRGLQRDPTSDDFANQYQIDLQQLYRDWLYNLVPSLISYDNLPDTISGEQLEMILRTGPGYAFVGKDKDTGIFRIFSDWYREPEERFNLLNFNKTGDPIYPVGTHKAKFFGAMDTFESEGYEPITRLDSQNGDYVVVTNKQNYYSYYDMSDKAIIEHFIEDVANIKAISRQNRSQLRQSSVVLTGNKNLTGDDIASAILNGVQIVNVDKDFDLQSIRPIANSVQSHMKELADEWTNVWNDFWTQLGVNNIAVDKAERLVTAEANGNNQLILSSMLARIKPRQRAFELFNKRFNEQVEVTVNVDINLDMSSINEEMNVSGKEEGDAANQQQTE